MDMTKQVFRALISKERASQLEKWGEQHHSDERWLAILIEEVGEVAKAILENDDAELLNEMCQVGAVLEAWATSRVFEGVEIKDD